LVSCLESRGPRLTHVDIGVEQRTVRSYLEGEVRHGSKKREIKCACSIP